MCRDAVERGRGRRRESSLREAADDVFQSRHVPLAADGAVYGSGKGAEAV